MRCLSFALNLRGVSTEIEVFGDYLQYERRLAPLTTQAYLADVRQLFTYLADLHGPIALDAVGPSHLRSFLLHLSGQGVANVTLSRKLTSLRTFFAFGVEHLGWSNDPTALLSSPKKPHHLPPAVDEVHLGEWLKSDAFGDDYGGQRDLTVVLTLYLLGLRRAELLSMTLADISSGADKLRITGKRGKTRLLPVPQVLRTQWDHYLSLREASFGESLPEVCTDPNASAFLTDKGRPLYAKAVYNLVRKHLESAGWVEGRSPHLLRHAFASHLMDGGADLRSVQELMGHASLASTQVYLHASAKRLLEVYAKAHPRASGDSSHKQNNS